MTEPTPTHRTFRRALAWAVGVLVIHTLLYAFYAVVVGPRHKATRSDLLWYRAPAHLDLVFLGDSHPRSAIDPKIIGPTAVNLATGGEHYTKGYYRFKTLYEEGDRTVGAIVIPLDPNGFTGWHADAFAPEFVWGRYVDFFDLGRSRGERWKYGASWVKANVLPYTGELRTLNQLRSKRFGFGEALASGRFDWLGPRARAQGAHETAVIHFEGHAWMDPAQLQGFERQIAWAKANEIRVVAISYPLTDAYLRALKELGDPRALVQTQVIEPLAERHPEVIHLDYTDFYRGQPDLFADPHHLNRRGRVLFTREVARRLEQEGLLDPGR